MLDATTGAVTFDEWITTIEPGVHFREFESSDLYAALMEEKRNDYIVVFLSPQKIGNRAVSVRLIFDPNGIITCVNLGIIYENESLTWENWSEEREMKRKKDHDEWLKYSLGEPPYNYGWGEVNSYYDPRAGFSTVVINYL